MKVGDDAAVPFAGASRQEGVHLRERATMAINDNIFVARIGLEMTERGTTLDEGRNLINILPSCIAGEDAVEGRTAFRHFGL